MGTLVTETEKNLRADYTIRTDAGEIMVEKESAETEHMPAAYAEQFSEMSHNI